MTDHIPAYGSHQARSQVRQTLDFRGLQGLQRSVRHVKHVALRGNANRHLPKPISLPVVGTQLGDGIHADEAVSTPCAAEFRRFEYEGSAPPCGKALIEPDRCQRIRKQATHDGDNTIAFVGKLVELLA